MTGTGTPPGKEEFELTLLGPGYGESIVLHVGNGVWVLVDSCVTPNGIPKALEYLESLDLNPEHAVAMIVATHWHDDHIRGMAHLVEVCNMAAFCCASVFCEKEFLTLVGALADRHLFTVGSGVNEMYRVFSHLRREDTKPTLALANRRIFAHDGCEIWSLSPDDAVFIDFLKSLDSCSPREGQTKIRLPSLSPNTVAVALWVCVDDIVVLLGSDLEKRGWAYILQQKARPAGRASAFKVPHHGSANADEPGVWERMLESDPVAVLTPWHRGGRILPSSRDVQRTLSYTETAYTTANAVSVLPSRARRDRMVERTIRESGVHLRRLSLSPGAIRLRRPIGSQARWEVEQFGSACHLIDFVQP